MTAVLVKNESSFIFPQISEIRPFSEVLEYIRTIGNYFLKINFYFILPLKPRSTKRLSSLKIPN